MLLSFLSLWSSPPFIDIELPYFNPYPSSFGSEVLSLISSSVLVYIHMHTVLWPPHAKSWLIGKDWCWEGLGAGGEGNDRGWDGWMASLTRWTWVWVNSGSWWWTGRPGVLEFMGLQRVGHDWATELNWTECTVYCYFLLSYKYLQGKGILIPSWCLL